MNKFLFLSVKGNALDRGREIGSKARKQIAHNIETYKKIFMELSNIDWDTAKQRASQYIPMIEKYDKEIMQEIIGISEGAKQPLLDIVALNARSEIILNSDGCTSLAVLPGTTKNQETFLAQNWDWNNKIKDGIVILDIHQEN
ncbi:C45 family autoproteolytic acyltransferase/hydolase [Bacillus massiliigorillae]|uniref:C45 family autoproteolytic acyltransferase/hydolase n=1 Tax=Bacillus massiliigorillae TaxID=1243664 RepID=UPI0003AA65F0|nr:C45 family peptidase [Bacillus massiliigorillae]